MTKKYILLILIIILILISFVSQNELLDVKLKDSFLNNTEYIAVLVENEDGTYEEQNITNWSVEDHIFDASKSACIDNDGNVVPNALSFDFSAKRLKVDTNKTTYCYVYFSKQLNLKEVCDDYENLSTCMDSEYNNKLNLVLNLSKKNVGDMRRYQGVYNKVQNNYMCFGVNTTEECLGADYAIGTYDETLMNKYLYRILGISEDGMIKLLKIVPIGTSAWDDKCVSWDKSGCELWPDTSLFEAINGDSFLTNQDFVPAGWEEKIAYYDWKYGDLSKATYSGDEAYAVEGNWGNPNREGYNPDTEGSVNAKIGLMYIHDNLYAHTYGNPGWYGASQQVWLNTKYNSSQTSGSEYVITRSKTFWNYAIFNNGEVKAEWTQNVRDIRPVFYLSPDSKIINGSGTKTDPYLLNFEGVN